MAYDPENPPSLMVQNIGGTVGLRHYALMWTDPIATVLAPGYISNAEEIGMRAGDWFQYSDVNMGQWSSYSLICTAIATNGSATLEFPEVPEAALPYVETFDLDDPTAFVVMMIGGRQVRVDATQFGIDTFLTASQAEAEAGVINDKRMTPLRTAQAILAQVFAVFGVWIAGLTSKATPVDADSLLMSDSAAAGVQKRLSWANLKATIAATIMSWTKSQTWAEGAAIASAATLVIGTDGNMFHVTGTTGITLISGAASPVTLIFDGALTMTHSANLILPNSIDLPTVAGDVGVFVSDGGGVFRCVSFTPSAMTSYREGTWTPVLSFGGASVGITYTTQTGNWTRIGRLFFCTYNIVLSSKGSSVGTALISGLPGVMSTGMGIPKSWNNFSGLTSPPILDVQSSTSTLQIKSGTNGSAAIDDTGFANNTTLTGLLVMRSTT